MYMTLKWLRKSVLAYMACRATRSPNPATKAGGAFHPKARNARVIHGSTQTSSRYTAPGVPPTNKYRFFFQPFHISLNDLYIRTHTTPAPEPNQIRNRA